MFPKLLLIDEAHRLKPNCIEELRDIYDDLEIAMVLIGHTGIERTIMRYSQFYSRVGNAREFMTLRRDEIFHIVKHSISSVRETLSPSDFADDEAISAIIRYTGGNFRMVARLIRRCERIMKLNGSMYISTEIVDGARQTLMLGTEQ